MDEFKETTIIESTEKQIDAYQRKYKDIVCRKCGTVYPSLYKECPNCGFSMLRSILKYVILFIVIAAVFASIILIVFRIRNIEERLDTLESASESSADDSVDLSSLSYYQEQLLYSGADLAAFEGGGEYLIYAIQDGCSACEEMSSTVYLYLYYGYPDYMPMYFVTPESASDIFFDVLGCESTPSLYRIKNGEIVDKAEGTDEVYEMLDLVVAEAKAQTDEEE